MKLKVNDKVLIISGKDKGKTGHITRVIPDRGMIIVDKINIRVRHIKKTSQKAGQRITFEAPLPASKAMLLDPSTGKPTRVGYRTEGGKKVRYAKVSGKTISDAAAPATKAVKAEKPSKAKPASGAAEKSSAKTAAAKTSKAKPASGAAKPAPVAAKKSA